MRRPSETGTPPGGAFHERPRDGRPGGRRGPGRGLRGLGVDRRRTPRRRQRTGLAPRPARLPGQAGLAAASTAWLALTETLEGAHLGAPALTLVLSPGRRDGAGLRARRGRRPAPGRHRRRHPPHDVLSPGSAPAPPRVRRYRRDASGHAAPSLRPSSSAIDGPRVPDTRAARSNAPADPSRGGPCFVVSRRSAPFRSLSARSQPRFRARRRRHDRHRPRHRHARRQADRRRPRHPRWGRFAL